MIRRRPPFKKRDSMDATQQQQTNNNIGENPQFQQDKPQNAEENINEHPKEEYKPMEETKDKKKIRCKKWPQCKMDGCEYAHPTETVNIIFNFSVNISRNVNLERNVYLYILTSLANMAFIVQG